MRDSFKHLVSGLAFALVWWAIYSSPFARLLDVFVVAAIAGAIVWMSWDLFKWMCCGALSVLRNYPLNRSFRGRFFASRSRDWPVLSF